MAFRPALTDFYAFNGWALQFTTTPRAGLRDSWLTMRGNFAALGSAGRIPPLPLGMGRVDYGDEWDASVALPPAHRHRRPPAARPLPRRPRHAAAKLGQQDVADVDLPLLTATTSFC